MTSQDGKKRPLNSGAAPRARNRTVVLTSDIAGKVRASVQGGVANRGSGGVGEDDGFTRPQQGGGRPAEITYSTAADDGRPGLSFRDGERPSLSEIARTPAERPSLSRPPSASDGQGARTINPGTVGTSQVRASVEASHSSRPSMQQPPTRSAPNGPGHSGGQGSSARPGMGGPGGPSGGRDSLHGRPAVSSGPMRGTGGGSSSSSSSSTSSRGMPPLGSSTALANSPRTTSHRGGGHEVPLVPTALLLGFMVSFDENPYGEAFEIREGRTIVSSDLPMSGGTVLLIEDPSVGSMHAVLKADGNGTLILLDQLSESGTFVRANGEEEQQLSGDRAIIKHGDMVRFGCRSFKVSLLD